MFYGIYNNFKSKSVHLPKKVDSTKPTLFGIKFYFMTRFYQIHFQGLERGSWQVIITQGSRAVPMVRCQSWILKNETVLRDDQLCLHCDPGPLSRLPHRDRHQPCGETIYFSNSAKNPQFKIYKKQDTNTICALLEQWTIFFSNSAKSPQFKIYKREDTNICSFTTEGQSL